MAEDTLFELPHPQAAKPEGLTSPQQARVLRPVRNQIEWVARDLDASLPDDHAARSIWAFLERLDLSPFYASIKSVLGHAGHPTTDPQVLLALWLFATSEGIGSARQIDRLCEEHDAYRWLCGGVPVNYHTLSDFRVAHQEALDNLLTEILASMMDAGLVTLRHVAQDGMRVRASAGASSFRRESSLQRCLMEAEQQVAVLAAKREHPDPGRSARQEAARERAAKERQRRVEEALRRMPKVQAAKERRKKTRSKAERDKVSEARVSTTDPESRVMKMPDGGFRPAYNLQMATDKDSQVIVGVAVDTTGSDGGQAPPVLEQVVQRTGRLPKVYLMDGDFAKRGDITALELRGVTVYAPTRSPRTTTSGRTKAEPRCDDTPQVARWRERMETEEAKEIYKGRAATAECVNAHARRHSLTQLMVRGTNKVRSVLLLVAITHNLLRWIALSAGASLQQQLI
jgi:transposase